MSKGEYLAEFELYVMLAVLRKNGEAYGASIRREIEGRTGRPVSIGAVYATLGRLADKGFVEFELSEPRPVPGGRARKQVRLTEEGTAAVEHSSAMLLKMMKGTPVAEW
ncbi:MAG: PadR family transcriptional regulator [Gemmatimonadota bacterium]|jgi:PadR family transcriptional regulator PadR